MSNRLISRPSDAGAGGIERRQGKRGGAAEALGDEAGQEPETGAGGPRMKSPPAGI